MPTDTIRLDELLDQLAQMVGDDKDKARDVALALLKKDETQPIAQVLVTRGHSKRTAEAQGKLAEQEATVSRLKEELQEKEDEIQQLKNATPDIKKRVEEAEARWKTKVENLTGELETERRSRDEDKLEVYRQKFLQELGAGTELDELAAENAYFKNASRIRLNDQRKVEVLELGENTPYDAETPEAALKMLANDVKRNVNPKYRIIGRPDGGGGEEQRRTVVDRVSNEQVKEQKYREGGYIL